MVREKYIKYYYKKDSTLNSTSFFSCVEEIGLYKSAVLFTEEKCRKNNNRMSIYFCVVLTKTMQFYKGRFQFLTNKIVLMQESKLARSAHFNPL